MTTTKIVYWQEPDGCWVGHLEDDPDDQTQGESLDDLKEHLRELYEDLSAGLISGARKVENLVIST